LKPNEINSPYDSAKVTKARKLYGVQVFREPNYKTQIKNQEEFEKNEKNLNINDYVYLDFKQNLFDKSFDVQVKIYK